MTPVERDEKRRTILKAALAVFSQKGYDRATVADIARQARIAKGVVYDYFPSKEELFTDLFEYLFPRDEPAFRAFVARAGDPIAEIEATAAAVMGHYESLGDCFNVVAQFWARGQSEGVNQRFADGWREVYSLCRQSMAVSLQRGVAAGTFRQDIDVPGAAWALVAVVDGSILQWIHSRAQYGLLENGLASVRTILRGLVRDTGCLDGRKPFVLRDPAVTDRSVAVSAGGRP